MCDKKLLYFVPLCSCQCLICPQSVCNSPQFTGSQTPAALLEQISLQSQRPDEAEAASIICRPVERSKKDLIQVISSTYVQPQMPDYHLEMKTDPAGAPFQVELTVELPKVRTMSQCLLRMSKVGGYRSFEHWS